MASLRLMTKQLVDLTLDEISGVDHPASLVEGWLVSKSGPDPITASLVEALTQPEGPVTVSTLTPDKTTTKEVVAEPDESIAKALEDVQKELADARTEREELRKERDDLAEVAATEKAEAKVAGWDHVPELAEFAPVLRSLDADQTEAVVKVLDAVEIMLTAAEGSITKEIGSVGDSDSNDLEARAKALVADGTHPNFHVAIAAVAEAHPEMYADMKED